MGGKRGGGARTPYEAPNTLSSAQEWRVVDVVAEGEISGFARGNDAPWKSVYFDDTPVQNADGSYNFKGVTGYFMRGTPDQSYIPGFGGTERAVPVSVRVKKTAAVTRTVTDKRVSSVRVTLGVERNVQIHDNGDQYPATTAMRVELVGANGVAQIRQVSFTEKSSGVYYEDVVFNTLPPAPFNIRVTRESADAANSKLINATYFAFYVEQIDVKLSYPHTALAALRIDTDQFGSRMPRRNYLLRGKEVLVPSNYNPATRKSDGLWDGSFKTAWSDNPLWVLYDFLLGERFSSLARRLTQNDIDKFSFYAAAQYCDEMVPDGFGGQEPRYTFNLYETEARSADEVVYDICSSFTGLPVWNGHQLSVFIDRDADPVAMYTNADVVNGEFVRSSAALKSTTTAVHVQYHDKTDLYRSKVEPVFADNAAINRYGLNIKHVRAYGCTSRGQALRFGAWMLETEQRQQHVITFTLARQGLKHLPHDVIKIADNDHAGAVFAGRVLAVDGNEVTLDRAVTDAVGGQLQYMGTAIENGRSVPKAMSLPVMAQPAPNRVQLAAAPQQLAAMAAWALAARVRPQLYRALTVRENADEGTYTVTALLHDPAKYGAVDNAPSFETLPDSLLRQEPTLINGRMHADGSALVLSWDNLNADGQVLSYDIRLYRNGNRRKVYRHLPDATRAEVRFDSLPPGDYVAEVRGRDARGKLSKPITQAWSLNYNLSGVRVQPKLFAINLTWTLPDPVVSKVHTEIWYAAANDRNQAAKLAALPYPQNEYTLTGVKLEDRYWFWLRVVDDKGLAGEWTAPVQGVCDTDPSPILQQIVGGITESQLSQALVAQLDAKIADGDSQTAAQAAAALQQEAMARAAGLQAETAARTRALQQEATERAAAVNAARRKASADLNAKAAELGNKITRVEQVNTQQAQQISTVTAAQAQTAVGLETEKTARAQGDAAEAQARQVLAGRVTNAEASITQNNQLRILGDQANADAIAAMGVRVGQAESGITQLQTTVADNHQAAATTLQQVSARLDGLSIGGRNYLEDSLFKKGWWQFSKHPDSNAVMQVGGGNDPWIKISATDTYWKQLHLVAKEGTASGVTAASPALSRLESGEHTFSVEVRADAAAGGFVALVLASDRTGDNPREDVIPRQVQAVGQEWKRISITRTIDKPTHHNHWRAIIELHQSTVPVYIRRPKLERGSFATDWTPAPEDGVGDTAALAAELTTFQQAQAAKDASQTQELNAAKSQLAGHAAQITNLQTTKANSNQVVAMARQGLQAEWRGYTDTAKSQASADAQTKADAALTAAKADAQAKATAARQAAEAAAQAKANAAEAQAVAAAKGDATSKANAAQAQAIAEASARDAVIKQQAANDAQAKADTAKQQAIAVATQLNNATDAKVTALQNTVADNHQASATAVQQVSARLDQLTVGGRNYLRDTETMTPRWLLSKHGDEPNPLQEPQNGVLTLSGTTPHWKQAAQVSKTGAAANNPRASETLAQLQVGETYTLSFEARASQNGLKLTVDLREARVSLPVVRTTRKIHTLRTDWQRYSHSFVVQHSDAGAEALDYWWLGFVFYQAGSVDIRRPKLERGSVASDWTPAPEDAAADTAAVAAELTAHKQAQAGKDAAQTQEINTAKTQLAGHTAQIGSLQTTKADNSQVASLARQGLQAEWRSYTDTAKAQAATDAQAKANAAKTQAIAAATQLNNATDAKVTALQTTVANHQQAAATRLDSLEAAVSGGGNLNVDSEFVHGLAEQTSKGGTQAKWEMGVNLPGYEVKGVNIGYMQRTVADTGAAYFNGYRLAVTPGIYQVSIYVRNEMANASLAPKPYLRHLKPNRTWTTGVIKLLTAERAPLTSAADRTGTLADFTRWVANVDLRNSPELATLEVAIEFPKTTGADANSVLFFCRPMICEVGSLDAPPVPYSPGGMGRALLARINNAETAITQNQQALSSRVTAVEAKAGSNQANITSASQAVATLGGKVQALHTLKVETLSGGRKVASSLALGADGATGDSQVLIYADKFGLVHPGSKAIDTPFVVSNGAGGAKMALKGDFIATGAILGSHIKAHQTLTAPNIIGGSATFGNGRFTVNNQGQVSMSSQAGNVGMKLNNDRIEVYDETGTLRVRLGKLI